MEWNTQDCLISKAAKDASMLPSKIDQMKVYHVYIYGTNKMSNDSDLNCELF